MVLWNFGGYSVISAGDSIAKVGIIIQEVLEQFILNRLIGVTNAISEVRGLIGVRWQIIKADSGRGNGVDEGKRQARRLFLPDLCAFLKALALILAKVWSRVSEGKLGTSLISTSSLPSFCLTMGIGTRLPTGASKLGSVLLLRDFLLERKLSVTVRFPDC